MNRDYENDMISQRNNNNNKRLITKKGKKKLYFLFKVRKKNIKTKVGKKKK